MHHLKTGDKAPDFKATIESGAQVTLGDYKGKKLILYFYPRDNTPTCTIESCNLRDNYKELIDEGYEILGISPDSEKKHQSFISKYNLPFSLIADTDHKMMKDYGVWGPKKFMGKKYIGVHRTTFVIDEEGVISNIILKVKAKSHTQQILETE